MHRVTQDDVLGPVLRVDRADVAEPPGNGGHVHRRVAAADHQHLFLAVAQAALVERFQKGDARDAVGGIAAGHRQRRAGLGAGAEEHCVELVAQLVERQVDADLDLGAHLDADIDDALDLAVEDVAWGAVAGNAIAHHAAELVVLLEHGAGVAHAPELVGAGEARRPAADQRHLLAGVGARRVQREAMFQRVVADELLDGVDADMVLDLVAIAAVLARRRAHAPHDRRERVGLDQSVEGVFLPRHLARRLLDAARDIEPATDILAGGTAALARRRAVDVGRALVRGVGDEDLFLPRLVDIVAVLIAAVGQFFFAHGRITPLSTYAAPFPGGHHASSLSLSSSSSSSLTCPSSTMALLTS